MAKEICLHGTPTQNLAKSNHPLVPSLENPGREAECLTCRDGRWVKRNVPLGHEDWGKIIPCPNCSQWREDEERKKSILRHSGIPEARRECNLASFHYAPGAEDAFAATQAMAEGKADFIWLLLYGGTGNGKTHLAYAIGLAAMERGLTVRFYTTPKLFAEMRLAIGIEGNSIDQVILDLAALDLLILDDIGVEAGSDWEKAKLDEIIDARYASKKLLVATSNMDPRQLPDRIRSRFKDVSLARMVWNKAQDYRPQKRVGKD